MLKKDCCDIIDTYLNLADFAKMMTVNKEGGKHGMFLLGKAYGKEVPVGGAMHMGRLVPEKMTVPAKMCLLRGVKYAEAVLKKTCMICEKPCSNVLEYGFVGHSKCVKTHEGPVHGKKYQISEEMVPHLKNLRMRRVRTKMHAVKYGIYGVYPQRLSLYGYRECETLDIARARETVATRERVWVQQQVEREERRQAHALTVRKEIEEITGVPFGRWFASGTYDDDIQGKAIQSRKTAATWKDLDLSTAVTHNEVHNEEQAYQEQQQQRPIKRVRMDPQSETPTTIPSGFVRQYRRFQSGKDCLDTLKIFRDHPELCEKMDYVLYTNFCGDLVNSVDATKHARELLDA